MKDWKFALLLLTLTAMIAAMSCRTETVIKEVPVEKTVVVDREVIKRVPHDRVVTLEKEIIRQVPVEQVVTLQNDVVLGVGGVLSKDDQRVVGVRVASLPASFTPFNGAGVSTQDVLHHVASRLVAADPIDLGWQPDLAERWEVSANGSEWTFHLRKGATFHDGEPVTASDVAYSLNEYVRAGGRFAGLTAIDGAEDLISGHATYVHGIVPVDDNTLVLRTVPTSALMDALWQAHVLPEHILGGVPGDDLEHHSFFSDLLVGSGPYVFVPREHDNVIELRANRDYYMGAPGIARKALFAIEAPFTAVDAFRRGVVAVNRAGRIETTNLETLLSDPLFEVAAVGGSSTSGYAFNTQGDLFGDVNRRRALMHALDRAALIERHFGGLGAAYNSVAFLPIHRSLIIDSMYAFDTQRARYLLERSHWQFDRSVAVKTPSYVVAPAGASDQIEAERRMLLEAGLKIEHEIMDVPSWTGAYYGGDYDLARAGGWTPFIDAATYLQFHSQGANPNGYAHPELDGYIDSALTTSRADDGWSLGYEISYNLARGVPVAPVTVAPTLHLYASSIYVPGFDTPGRQSAPVAGSLSEVYVQPLFRSDAHWWWRLDRWTLDE